MKEPFTGISCSAGGRNTVMRLSWKQMFFVRTVRRFALRVNHGNQDNQANQGSDKYFLNHDYQDYRITMIGGN